MLRDASIRTKLIAIFILPALGTVTLAALCIATDFRDGQRSDRESRATALAVDAATLAHELGAERDRSAVWLARGRADSPRPEILSARARADRAALQFLATAAGLGHTRRDPVLGSRLAAATAGLGRLAATRQAVDQRPTQRSANARRCAASRCPGPGLALERPGPPVTVAATIAAYSDTIGDVLSVAARLPAGVAHRELARDLDAFMALAQAEESASLTRGLGAAVAIAERFQGQDYQRLAAALGARQRELARFQATATPAQQELYSSTVETPRVEHADELEALLLDAGGGATPAGGAMRAGGGATPAGAARLRVLPDQWLQASGERVGALRIVVQKLGAQTLGSNLAITAAAKRQLLSSLGLLIVVVVLTFALAAFLARSMINPLAALEQAARDVAERRLPGVVERLHRAEAVDIQAETRPIAVGSRGEIGRVAEAFTAVQRVAVSVAMDQAVLRESVSEMFVSMARRSQRLIDRQLALIDHLEKNETNPDQLDQFFKLDHLATRMRRNAESLMVLSGAEPAHGWSRPVPLASLVRAAVAEVEDYTRVQILPMDGVELAGPAGIDVAHLLAELIENATSYSPPDTSVVVAGERVSSGYLIEIEDRGDGLSDEELLAANERLANPPLADLTISHMLGFYVVGRLAQRHGIKVQLRHSSCGGVTALVLLAASMVAGGDEARSSAGRAAATGTVRGALRPLTSRAGARSLGEEAVRAMVVPPAAGRNGQRDGRRDGRVDEP